MEDRTLYVAGLVAYDGTDYHGYQYQIGVPTVQDELESALAKFCQTTGRVSAAGRTDAGVHAIGQVIAVQVFWRHDVRALQNAWNAHLPKTICIRRLESVDETFHPRFSALKRTYRYRIRQPNRQSGGYAERLPLTDRYTWYVRHELDVIRMQEAADHLIGEHDFGSFGQPTQGESTVRKVVNARWQVYEEAQSEWDVYCGRGLVFTITANGFLRQMVRTITGTLVEVGLGNLQPDDVSEMLKQVDRSQSAPPAPARGLTLEHVAYAEGDPSFTCA